MDVVLGITAPIFMLILLGYVGIRAAILPKEALPALSKFVLFFALPSVMVTKISAMDMNVIFNASFVGIYALGGLLTFALTVGATRLFLKETLPTSSVTGLGAMMPNSSFIGFPILLQFLDGNAAQAFAMVLMVENIVFLPLGLILIEMASNQGGGVNKAIFIKVLKRITTNPIILSVFAGVVMSSTGLHFPAFIGSSLTLLSQAAAPTALFVIGGSLVGVVMHGSRLRIGLVALMKLICFPLVVFTCVLLTPQLAPELGVALVVFSAMPMFSIYPIIGGEYGQRGYCASSLLVTTVASFFSISALLAILV